MLPDIHPSSIELAPAMKWTLAAVRAGYHAYRRPDRRRFPAGPEAASADNPTTPAAPPARAELATYVLPLPAAPGGPASPGESAETLSGPLLAENVLWFCQFPPGGHRRLRARRAVGRVPAVARALTLRPPGLWPFLAAGVLVLGNVLFRAHGRALQRRRSGAPGEDN